MIMEKSNQVLDKQDRSQTLIDNLNDKVDNVNKGEENSQRNPPSIKSME